MKWIANIVMRFSKTIIAVILGITLFFGYFIPQVNFNSDAGECIPPDYYEVKDSHKTHFVIVADTHFNSPFALKLDLEDIPKGENTVYLGDIYEVVWAKHEEVDDIVQKVKQLRENVGDRYVRGNHEGNAFRSFLTHDKNIINAEYGDKKVILSELDCVIRSVRNQNILFVHGHKGIASDYDVEEIQTLEETKGGRGLIFQLILPIAAPLKQKMKPDMTPEQEINNAIRLATTMNCQTIVFGHTHIKSLFDKTFKDEQTGKTIRVINVPRGVTHLEL